MRINDVKRFLVTDTGRTSVYVKIETDSELYGIGEATINSAPRAVVGLLDDLRELLVGRDARRIEWLWQHCYRRLFYRGGPVFGAAISGIDQALWDLQGKALHVPVYRLIGGLARDRLRYYVHLDGDTPDAAASSALEAVAKGATAVRFAPVQATDDDGMHDHRAAVDRSIAHLAAIRAAVGPEVDLLLECHGRFDTAWAGELARRAEPFRPFFVEDPIRHELHDGMARLRTQTTVPLAMGERAHDKWSFRELIEHEYVNYVRPDVCHCGGISEMKKIAAMAETHYIDLVPHNVAGPVGTSAGVHVAFATSNVALIEAPWVGQRDHTGITGPFPTVEGGYILPPEGPGLGISFDEAACRAAQFEPRLLPEILAPDGAVRDW